jgi:hypothetical protein
VHKNSAAQPPGAAAGESNAPSIHTSTNPPAVSTTQQPSSARTQPSLPRLPKGFTRPLPAPRLTTSETAPRVDAPFPNLSHFSKSYTRPQDVPQPPRRGPSTLNSTLPPTTPDVSTSVTRAKPHKPRKGCEIDNNDLRPHVLAEDRLRVWKAPFSLDRDAAFRADLPPEVVDKTYAALFSSFAPETYTNYTAGLLRLHQFCDLQEIPERARMPASHFLLAAFIANHVGTVGGGTVKS